MTSPVELPASSITVETNMSVGIRCRPSMYLGEPHIVGFPAAILRAAVGGTFDADSADRPLRVDITVHDNRIFTIEDNGRNIPVGPRDGNRRARDSYGVQMIPLPSVLTDLCAGGPYRGSVLPVITAYCAETIVVTWGDGHRHRICAGPDHTVGPIETLGPASGHGTRITCRLDDNHVPPDEALPADLTAVLLPENHPRYYGAEYRRYWQRCERHTVDLRIVDERSGTESTHRFQTPVGDPRV